MWDLFKKRQDGDLRRLISAYRYFLKAVHQTETERLSDETQREMRKWKGGFGKAYNQLFMDWPSPHQSRRFEKKMQRWLPKTDSLDHAFVQAFNDFLGQKRLNPEEMKQIMEEGRSAFNG